MLSLFSVDAGGRAAGAAKRDLPSLKPQRLDGIEG